MAPGLPAHHSAESSNYDGVPIQARPLHYLFLSLSVHVYPHTFDCTQRRGGVLVWQIERPTLQWLPLVVSLSHSWLTGKQHSVGPKYRPLLYFSVKQIPEQLILYYGDSSTYVYAKNNRDVMIVLTMYQLTQNVSVYAFKHFECALILGPNNSIWLGQTTKGLEPWYVAPVLLPSTAVGPSHTNPAVSSSASVLELNADEFLDYMERSSRQGEGSARLTVSPSPTPSCLIQTPLNQFSPPQTPIRRITSPLSHFTPSPSPQPQSLPRLSPLPPRYRPFHG